MIEVTVTFYEISGIPEETYRYPLDEYMDARKFMEDCIFKVRYVESVILFVPDEHLTEMKWTYTSEDGHHPLESTVWSEDKDPSLWSEHHIDKILTTDDNWLL